MAEVYGAGASLAGREEIAAMAAEVAEQDPSQQAAAVQVGQTVNSTHGVGAYTPPSPTHL